MQHHVKITVMRNTILESDSPFEKGTGPLQEYTICDIVSAWDLLNHPERDKIVIAEFIDEQQYLDHVRKIT